MRDAAALLLVNLMLPLGCTDSTVIPGSAGSAGGGGASHTNVSAPAGQAGLGEAPLLPQSGGGPPTQVEPNGGSASEPVAQGGANEGGKGLRVAVISDLNDSYGSVTYAPAVGSAVKAIVALEPDLVISTGDMVAGQMAGLDYEAMWDGFHAAVTDVLAASGLPLAVTPGNHDASGYAGYETEREIFVSTWREHKPELAYVDDSSYPLRYSFSYGPALFVSLDDSTIGALDTEQMVWLDAQLAQGQRFATKIVYGHVPLVPFSEGRETEIIGDSKLEALLEQHGVTLFISGHHHAYYPGRRGSVRYVSTACLGAGPRPLIGTEAASARSLVVFDLDPAGNISLLDARAGNAFDTPVPRASLPDHIESGDWTVRRDDLP